MAVLSTPEMQEPQLQGDQGKPPKKSEGSPSRGGGQSGESLWDGGPSDEAIWVWRIFRWHVKTQKKL